MSKIVPNKPFPSFTLPTVSGEDVVIGAAGDKWQLIVVYRGMHCPLCVRYLQTLQELEPEFVKLGFQIVTLSTDGEAKARKFATEAGISFPVGHSLSLEQAYQLGLYVSFPRNEQETDAPFAEPGLFVVQPSGNVHIADVSNAPFSRPDLRSLLGGLQFVLAHDYPVRGTRAADGTEL